MGSFTSLARRLFGYVVIDALGLNKNGWYIDDVQVTATAAQLNSSDTVADLSVTASTLASDVAGRNLTGGNGTALKIDPTCFHAAHTAGTGVGVNIPQTGVRPGDVVTGAFAFNMGGSLSDRTSEYVCGTDVFIKAAGSNDTGRYMTIYWVDQTA